MNPQEAMASEKHDGLMVLGVFAKVIFFFIKLRIKNKNFFIQLGTANSELDKILSHFNKIHFEGNVDQLSEKIDWMKLFPGFYFYIAYLSLN